MDLNSPGEDTVIKTRKPYTITRERGRWTTEEHDRFLEALKVHGRDWPRIREHVGTKTTLQIRSHAQKFFAKLENKAHFKGGIPRGEAPDIDIPPPRRKRKSTDPYPQETRPASPSSQPEIRDEKLLTPTPSLQTKLILDFEEERLHKKSIGEEQTTNEIENRDNNCSKLGNAGSRDNDMICILRSSPNLQTPFIPLRHHTDDHIHASPTFSNHISSALLRNPTAHAAASYAAALWPEESAVCNHRCFCCMQSKFSPGTEAIAGITVAAASAWWATHGLLPLSVPCHAALNCAPSIGNPVTTDGKAHQLTVSKESMNQNVNGAKKSLDRGKGLLTFELDDLNDCQIESWKEVSREGQLAFPVLYPREAFPQSFSPQQDAATRETIGNLKHIDGDDLHLSWNVKSGCRSRVQSSEKDKSPNVSEEIITIGLGHGMTSNQQSGFKPYKRCSIDKGLKKICSDKKSSS